MKKLLIATCILSVAIASASFADDTYTEKFIKKHTQGAVKKEKELNAKKQAQKKKIDEARKAQEKAKAKQQKKIQEKKDAINTLKKW